ncbi:efflux RND transporter periplasmic adaptor subunit, partial [Oscillatoriales cyanobacterium LEGE 11467]
AEVRQTDVKTAREDVRVAQANITAAQTEVSNAQANEANARATLANAIANVDNARANVESARARLESADANLLASAASTDSAEAGVRGEIANVNQLETQLEQTLVRAPESGTIAERIAQVGDVTGSGQQLFSIIRNGALELDAEVPETQLSQVQPGMSARITSDADDRINLRGTVREIAPILDEATREAIVEIDLPDSDLLRPGMFLNATIATDTAPGLTIPAQAVLPQPDGSKIVYKLGDDNIAIAQTVKIGELIGDDTQDLTDARIEVLEGLNEGDRVVVSGAGYVKDGDRVTVSD